MGTAAASGSGAIRFVALGGVTERRGSKEVVPMRAEDLEGWCTDPFGRHEARWLSQGTPTKLVRDGDIESYDDPPDEEPSQEAQLIEPDLPANGGADLIRVGDAASGPTDLESLDRQMGDAAFEGGAHPEADLRVAPPPPD
jgi:hypothetical protein